MAPNRPLSFTWVPSSDGWNATYWLSDTSLSSERVIRRYDLAEPPHLVQAQIPASGDVCGRRPRFPEPGLLQDTGVDTPGVQMSSCGLVEGGSVGPGGVFVVGGLVFEASVEDTYESVG